MFCFFFLKIMNNIDDISPKVNERRFISFIIKERDMKQFLYSFFFKKKKNHTIYF